MTKLRIGELVDGTLEATAEVAPAITSDTGLYNIQRFENPQIIIDLKESSKFFQPHDSSINSPRTNPDFLYFPPFLLVVFLPGA